MDAHRCVNGKCKFDRFVKYDYFKYIKSTICTTFYRVCDCDELFLHFYIIPNILTKCVSQKYLRCVRILEMIFSGCSKIFNHNLIIILSQMRRLNTGRYVIYSFKHHVHVLDPQLHGGLWRSINYWLYENTKHPANVHDYIAFLCYVWHTRNAK
jgi:hypothetical protein